MTGSSYIVATPRSGRESAPEQSETALDHSVLKQMRNRLSGILSYWAVQIPFFPQDQRARYHSLFTDLASEHLRLTYELETYQAIGHQTSLMLFLGTRKDLGTLGPVIKRLKKNKDREIKKACEEQIFSALQSSDSSQLTERLSLRCPEGSKIYPILHFKGGGRAKDITKGEVNVISEAYAFDLTSNSFILYQSPTYLFSHPEKYNRLNAILERYGDWRGERAEKVKNRFAVPRDFTFHPSYFELCNGTIHYHGEIACERFPLGSLKLDTETLLGAQRQMMQGEIASAVVEVSGLLTTAGIKWMRGSGTAALGPIPLVNVWYTLLLPSGASYRFSIHRSRFNPVSLPDNPVASYNEVDREVVRGLECYLALPRHRRDLSIFRYETLPQPLRDKMSSQYPQERPDWYPVVWERLKTYASKIIQSDQRLPQPPPTFESFRAQAVACIDEIAKLPHKGWPPNYFVTTLKEREYLLSEVVPRLHTILREEFERTNRDIATGKEAERRRLGYKGPIGGIPLSLKYGLMDHIVRIRQRETHRANLARARKIPIAEVTIPDDYGRSYARGDRFPTLVQVRDELLKVRSRRCVHLIFKELDGFHAEEIAPENVVKRYEERMIESCAVGHALSQEFASRYKEKNALRHEARVDLDLFLGLETRFQKRLQQHHLELEDLKLTETREMTQLGAARKSGMIEKNVLERAREGFQNQREQHQQARMHTLRSLLWLYQAKLPPDKFITGAPYAILDEELVRFIISIGGDDQIRITPEAIDSEGTHKHTHSEHLGGKNMYAGGEQIFARHKVFSLSLNAWLKFNATLQKEGPLPFKPMDLNDLSGHYEPPFSTLLYARNKIFPALAQLGFSLAKCHVIDRVATGVALQEDESIFT